jgi:nucleoside-diphosphate-sugar epimerase
MHRALVTGANGFIGSHLVERLVREGVSVRCLVRKTSNLRWISGLPVEHAVGALDDGASLLRAMEGIDTVFHLGGRTKASSREAYFEANARGTERLLEAALRNSPVPRRFVFASTQAVAGPSRNGLPVAETQTPRPVTWYGESKWAGEEAVLRAGDRMAVVVVRPPTVFGPRDTDVLGLFRSVQKGVLPLLGWRNRYVSVVYVDDLVQGLCLAARKPEAVGQVFFVTTADCLSWRSLGRAVAEAGGRKAVPVHVPVSLFAAAVTLHGWRCRAVGKESILNRSKIPDFLPRFWICDGSKARRELGLAPACTLDRALRTTWSWYRQEGWV